MAGNERRQGHARRPWLTVFALGLALGSLGSMRADAATADFRIGLTVTEGAEANLSAPVLPLPSSAVAVATSGASRYHVSTDSGDETRRDLRSALLASGYRIVRESASRGRWHATWRPNSGEVCVETDIQPVLGADLVRIKSTTVICR